MYYWGILLICCVLISGGSVSFTESIAVKNVKNLKADLILPNPALVQAKEQFLNGLNKLKAALLAFKATVAAGSLSELKDKFKQSRYAYKQIEFWLDYLSPETVELINGPDLPRLDPHIPGIAVITPGGFQTIESILFDTEIFSLSLELKSEIITQLDELVYHTDNLIKTFSIFSITDRHVLEAVRGSIIRAMTLGITSFDSPLAKDGIAETKYLLLGAADAIEGYRVFVMQSASLKGKELGILLAETLHAAINRLSVSSDEFDLFDRAFFIREYGNTLLAAFTALHQLLRIETRFEATGEVTAVNNTVGNLFAVDFLNPQFYALLKNERYDSGRVNLGRLLFFDPLLSADGQRSCASCHKPELAFTDGKTKSVSFGQTGEIARNSPTLLNAVYQKAFFYDASALNLEEQVSHVVNNKAEFHTSFDQIIERLYESEEYLLYFRRVYPSYDPKKPIDMQTISRSIAAYLRTLTALNSDFDKYMRKEKTAIDTAVLKGFNLFMGKAKCGTCHFAPIFNGTIPPNYDKTEVEVLGVPANASFESPILDGDIGRYAVKPAEFYYRAFKTPTVRNSGLTAPYMHNGVYKTLAEVIEFYNVGGAAGLGLSINNQTLLPDSLHLNKTEQQALIKFLNALTDTSITNSSKQIPMRLPHHPTFTKRIIGGVY